MTAEAIESRKLDIGVVLQTTFQVLGRNLATFTILGLVLTGLPATIIAYASFATMGDQATELARGAFTLSPGYFQAIGLSGIAGLILTTILQGALIYATVQDLNGQKASVADCLATGLRNFLALIAVTILLYLAVGFGMVLLLVPGLMIACAWCVAIPALVADRTGIFGAFSRAADLTRGNRWRIFGLGILLWIVLLVVSTIANAISGVSNLANLDGAEGLAVLTSPAFLVLSVIRSTVSAVVGSTLVAVLYVELRRLRDGAGPQWLAEIFS